MLDIGLFSVHRYWMGLLPAALTNYHNTHLYSSSINYGIEQKGIAHLGYGRLSMFERSAMQWK